jgi:hypothetical protein
MPPCIYQITGSIRRWASTIPRGKCGCIDQWPYWPIYILAITATESIIKRSERPYMKTSLEGCEKVWGPRSCKYEPAVDKGLWGMSVIRVWAYKIKRVAPKSHPRMVQFRSNISTQLPQHRRSRVSNEM